MEYEEHEFDRRDRPPPEEDPAREEETSFWNRGKELLWGKPKEPPAPPKFPPTDSHSKIDALKDELETQNHIEELRKFFKQKLKYLTSPDAGEFSRELFENSKLTYNEKSGKVNGVEFKGRKILVRGGKFNTNLSLTREVSDFKEIIYLSKRRTKTSKP